MPIAKVIATERTTSDGVPITLINIDFGGGDAHSAELYQGAGDDALPMQGDYVECEPGPESGTWVVVGVHDPRNAGKALPGERRLYVRDEDGNTVGELYASRDEITVEGFGGHPIRLKTTGPVILDSPDVRLNDAAGSAVARVGDIVAVTIPGLQVGGAAVTLGVGVPIAAAGQIVSGQSKSKA